MLGTEVTVKIFSHSRQENLKVVQKVFSEIERVEKIASFFDETSELSRLNSQAQYKAVKLSDELFFLIEKGLQMSEISNGAFDITATSLGVKNGYKSIVIDREKKEIYFKDKRCLIDLGAYAKGYAVDRAVEVLRLNLINNVLVDAGGDMRLLGVPLPKKEWAVGIRNPRNPRDIFKVIRTSKEASISTSGNYLREHIVALEDRDSSVLSVTVVSETVMEADLLSTALFNMSAAGRLKLMEYFDNIEVLVIVEDGDGGLRLVKEKDVGYLEESRN